MEDNTVAIMIPTLYRWQRLESLIKNIHEVTPLPHKLYFMVADDDFASQGVLVQQGEEYFMDTPGGEGDMRFPYRIQYMYERTTEPWFFTGADDVVFHPGWLEAAFNEMQPHHNVITFNDTCNAKGTNFLIRRSYVETESACIDVPNQVYYPPYLHNFSDDELVSTACYRGCFLKCSGIVEHFHPAWRKNTWDATYGRAQDVWKQDEDLYWSRTHLWNNVRYFGENADQPYS